MDNIAEWWANFFEHATFWSAFWPAVWGAVVGAAAAFLLERRYRERERIAREVGECNRLIFTLGQMLSTLEDFQEVLFEHPRKAHGREPKWNEIGALPGAPTSGPAFVIGEYTFLLEDRDTTSDTPKVLGRAYFAASRFNSALALVHERTALYDRHQLQRVATQFSVGSEAAPGIIETEALGKRIEQLTMMLAEDLPEAIDIFRTVLGQLHETLSARYPGRQFINLSPMDGTEPRT
ncbi:MAG: hypothetical protein WD795_18950 [Woeseia sp.]